jgi:hypothetical protein
MLTLVVEVIPHTITHPTTRGQRGVILLTLRIDVRPSETIEKMVFAVIHASQLDWCSKCAYAREYH